MIKTLQERIAFYYQYCLQIFRKFVAWRIRRYNRYKTLVWYRKMLNATFTLFVFFLLFLFSIDINFLWLYGKSPSMKSISNPPQSLASEIISSDNKLIGKYFNENRKWVEFEELSPALIKTLISTEDERFYKHFGIDVKGVFAAMKDAVAGSPRGASTISQQLVKNMYKTRDQYSTGLFGYIPGVKLIIMKMKEWITAVKIEIFYSKNEILTKYFNTVDFGSNAYGIHTAAKTYFGVHPSELNYEQSAVLVGLLKATTSYNPILNPKRSKSRRNVVLDNLYRQGHLSKTEVDSLKLLDIDLRINIEQAHDGEALHFRNYLAKHLEEWEKANGYDIYADGLKIYVSIDSRLQKYAEQAVEENMRRQQKRFFEHWRGRNPWRDENDKEIENFVENIAKRTKYYRQLDKRFDGNIDSITHYLNIPRKTKVFDYELISKDTTLSVMDSIRYMNHYLHAAFAAMEPNTGLVRAWVGDINFDFWQYDKVAQSKRQPGSTFKLFVYTAAMMNGVAPCDRRNDQPITWEYPENGETKRWQPKNANRSYSGNVSVKYAFARSINTVAVQLAKEFGIDEVIKYAHLLGIKTELENKPSTSLGSSDVSLLELLNSFATIVDEGNYKDPILVTKIEDKNGKVIYKAPKTHKRVIPYEPAWLMTTLLRAGMSEPGATTQALWEYDIFNYNTNFGGKTGTSSNYSDAWFVGVSPKLIGGAWVGGEHRSVHFRNSQYGEGSKTALPIFGLFMEKVLKDKNFEHYREKFPDKPKQTISRSYNCYTVIKRDTVDVDESNIVQEQEAETAVAPQ